MARRPCKGSERGPRQRSARGEERDADLRSLLPVILMKTMIVIVITIMISNAIHVFLPEHQKRSGSVRCSAKRGAVERLEMR